MKTATHLRILAGVLAAASLLNTAEAAERPPDFSEFAGRYVGRLTTVTFSDDLYFSTANVRVTVPRNGASATITVTGSLTADGQRFPLSNTFLLTRGGAMTVSDVVFNLVGSTGPFFGTYRLNNSKVTYVGTFTSGGNDPISVSGTIRVNPRGKKKRKLTVVLKFISEGTTYRFPFVAISK